MTCSDEDRKNHWAQKIWKEEDSWNQESKSNFQFPHAFQLNTSSLFNFLFKRSLLGIELDGLDITQSFIRVVHSLILTFHPFFVEISEFQSKFIVHVRSNHKHRKSSEEAETEDHEQEGEGVNKHQWNSDGICKSPAELSELAGICFDQIDYLALIELFVSCSWKSSLLLVDQSLQGVLSFVVELNFHKKHVLANIVSQKLSHN